MYRERKSIGRVILDVIVLLLLICLAAFLVYLRYDAVNDPKPTELLLPDETLLNEASEPDTVEISELVQEEPIESIPEELPTVPEEPVMQPEEIIIESLPVIDNDNSEFSFYQKLNKGCNVNILIMGDSCAAGVGASEAGQSADGRDHRWFVQLSDYLSEAYLNGQKPYIKSLASEKASVIQDVLEMKNSTDTTDYDLILLTYGLNEETKTGLYFESLILTLREKFPNASFITTLEPCLHQITAPMEFMRGVCYEYGIPIVNLYEFIYNNSGSLEEYLKYFDEHQVFPGDRGQDEWFELLKDEIDTNVKALTDKMTDRAPIDNQAPQFAAMKFINVNDSCVTRVDDTSYSVDAKVNGLGYMVHRENLGNNDAKVIADDILYQFKKPDGIELADGSYLTLIYPELVSDKSFSISFSSKEYADELQGLYFYYPKQ